VKEEDRLFWSVITQTIRVMRNPAEYVRREDERARRLGRKIRAKAEKLIGEILDETERK
jgi:hypothetical protein